MTTNIPATKTTRKSCAMTTNWGLGVSPLGCVDGFEVGHRVVGPIESPELELAEGSLSVGAGLF